MRGFAFIYFDLDKKGMPPLIRLCCGFLFYASFLPKPQQIGSSGF
jgi:hypothetical protein